MALSAGTIFASRYEVGRVAGRGGMGTVYRAFDRHRGGWVALKVLQEADDPGEVDALRFAREAAILAELQHAGIVAYVDHGRDAGGRRYLVMEWLDGENLAQRLARGPLSVNECLDVFRAVAEALDLAHRRGVVHRDIKPSNIFLVDGTYTQAKLLDFGIARRGDARAGVTRTGLILGTPEYMAPEQARGERSIGPAADIFSLGCVLYECLAGRSPFAGAHVPAVLVRILFETPPRLCDERPGVPDALSGLVAAMLAKEPSERPDGALTLIAALASIRAGADDRFAPTLPGDAGPRRTGEQQLFCVVLASADAADSDEVDEPTRDGPDLEALGETLAQVGARAEWLIDGTLVVHQTTTGSAIDQALKTARLAWMIQERWPAAVVTLATGLGAAEDGVPVGEVVDRATSMLMVHRERGAGPRVWVDEVSAGLLARRFTIDTVDGSAFLSGAEVQVDDTYHLLGRPTSCVGREQELITLAAILGGCIEESEARSVLVTAPAGAGKSRLRHEFLKRARAGHPELTELFGLGDMMRAGASYGILAAALRRLCGVTGGESAAEQRRLLAERLGRHLGDGRARVLGFLGELCGVPFPDEDEVKLRAARQDPRIMADLLVVAFLEWLAAECRQGPVLLVLEDLHWSDTLTIQLIDAALRDLRGHAFMVLALARPEVHDLFPNLWHSRSLNVLQLAGLSRKACERLIQQVLGEISEDVVVRLYTRSAGNALYLEEFIRALRDGKRETLPGTVLAMLQARLGRVDPACQQMLMAASVFGATFWATGVQALQAGSEGGSESILERLLADELIERSPASRFSGDVEYTFRHALIREAAYSLLGEDSRAAYHAKAAQFLASREAEAIVIAEHHRGAGARALAVPYYVRAAAQALDSYDLQATLVRARAGLQCDPQGEELGILLAIEATALFWLNEPQGCYEAGQRALPLLAVGSAWWCRAMVAHVMVTVTLAKMPEFAELTAALMATTPSPAGMGAFLEALAFLLVSVSAVGQRAFAGAVLAHMQRIAADGEGSDLHSQMWIAYGSAYHCFFLAADPWRLRTLAQELATIAGSIAFQRMVGIAGCYVGLADLLLTGADGEATVHAALALLRTRQEVRSELYWTAILLPIVAYRGAEADAAGIHAEASRVLAQPVTNSASRGLASCALACLDLAAGRLDEAAARMPEIHGCLVHIPTHRLFAADCAIRLAIARGAADEAVRAAEDALQTLASIGGGGPVEVRVRLAAAEAFRFAEDGARAEAELALAVRQIDVRAEGIADPGYRETFMTQVPENRRTLALAAVWASRLAVDGRARCSRMET